MVPPPPSPHLVPSHSVVGLNFSTSGSFLPPPTAAILSLSEQSNPFLTPVSSENEGLCRNQEQLSKRTPTISDCGLCHKGRAGGQCNSNFPLTSLQSPSFMEVSSSIRYRVLFCHLYPWLNLFKDFPQFKSNSKSNTFLSVTHILLKFGWQNINILSSLIYTMCFKT